MHQSELPHRLKACDLRALTQPSLVPLAKLQGNMLLIVSKIQLSVMSTTGRVHNSVRLAAGERAYKHHHCKISGAQTACVACKRHASISWFSTQRTSRCEQAEGNAVASSTSLQPHKYLDPLGVSCS